MTSVVLSDGRAVVIREAGAGEFLSGGSGKCPAGCSLDVGEEGDSYARELSELVTGAIGATAIVALDDRRVVGFVSFFPSWMPHADWCKDEQIGEALAYMKAHEDVVGSDGAALHVRCLMIEPSYRGNGLAVELLLYLKVWAREQGWKKIVGNGCIFSGKAQYQWLVAPKPPRPIWEKAGFSVQDYTPLNLKAVSDEESARSAFDWYKSEGFPEHLPRDVAVDAPDWVEIFSDYTMVCEL